MKSLYKRELAMMVGIVTLSFTLLSTAFMLLSYRYIISETRDRLERNAGYIASATGNYLQNFNSWNIFDNRADTWILYQTTMETVSSVSDASVIVASTQGEILYASDEGMYSKQIPQQIVDQILERGNYAGLTNLNGIYGSNRYIAGLPVQVQLDNPNLLVNVGVVLVSGDTSGLSEMWRSRGGGPAHCRHRQLHYLRPPDPPPHRDGGGRPEIRTGRVRRAGEQLQGPVR